MEEGTERISNVRVVRASDFGWFCEHEGQPLFIGRAQVPPGTAIPAVGVSGTVEVYSFALGDIYPSGRPRRRGGESPEA